MSRKTTRDFFNFLINNNQARQFFADLDYYEAIIADRDYYMTHQEEAEPGQLEDTIDEVIIAREALEEYLSEYNHSHRNTGATLETIINDAEDHRREALEREPTEEGKRSATASPVTVGTLETLENEIYSAYGVDSKPAGLKWVDMALDLARRITDEPDLLDAITDADLDQLTEDNFHTARHAAEVARYLKKYII